MNIDEATSLAKKFAQSIGHDFSKSQYTLNDMARGIIVETEHDDVTLGDRMETAKIAHVHLKERPDYYDGLEIVEEAPENYWRNYWARQLMIWLLIIVIMIVIIYLHYDMIIDWIEYVILPNVKNNIYVRKI